MKRMSLVAAAVLLATLASASTVGAAGQLRTGEKISLLAAPEVFPAGEPFYLQNGNCFLADGLASRLLVTNPGTRVEFVVDGEEVVEGRVVEFSWIDCEFNWVNYRSGLPAGIHHFEGRAYEAGELILLMEAEISFE